MIFGIQAWSCITQGSIWDYISLRRSQTFSREDNGTTQGWPRWVPSILAHRWTSSCLHHTTEDDVSLVLHQDHTDAAPGGVYFKFEGARKAKKGKYWYGGYGFFELMKGSMCDYISSKGILLKFVDKRLHDGPITCDKAVIIAWEAKESMQFTKNIVRMDMIK